MTAPGVAPAPTETDAVVVGAGPVGLFQVFQLGLQEIRAHVVDSLPHVGGQCVELYGDKPIYDIPAVPVCTGRELAQRLLAQAEPFGATYHLGQEVSTVARQPDGRLLVGTSRGTRFLTKTLFIAAGVGAFQPRKLKVAGIEAFEGAGLHYRVDDASAFAGRELVIVGGDEVAVGHALRFAGEAGDRARTVTLVHRRDVLQASPALLERFDERRRAGAIRFVIGQPTGFETREGALSGLKVTAPDATTDVLPLDDLLVVLGLSPKLGPIADWGLALERKQLVVDTETFSTAERGIFAVGDINTYPGKKKLILCGFHEATLAAFGATAVVFPGKDIHLQYTTTSPRLHELLGVATPGER